MTQCSVFPLEVHDLLEWHAPLKQHLECTEDFLEGFDVHPSRLALREVFIHRAFGQLGLLDKLVRADSVPLERFFKRLLAGGQALLKL